VGEVEGQVKDKVRSVRLTWGKRVGARDLETAGCTEGRGAHPF
jgi:hypothetical protein